jgi:hypothetical protein
MNCPAIQHIEHVMPLEELDMHFKPPPTPKNENKNLGIGFFSFLKYIILYPESLLIPRQSLEKTIGWVATYCLVVHCGLEEGS